MRMRFILELIDVGLHMHQGILKAVGASEVLSDLIYLPLLVCQCLILGLPSFLMFSTRDDVSIECCNICCVPSRQVPDGL